MVLRAIHSARFGQSASAQSRNSANRHRTQPGDKRTGAGSRPAASIVRSVRNPTPSIAAARRASMRSGFSRRRVFAECGRMGSISTTGGPLRFGGRRYFIPECDPDSQRFEPSASDAFQQTIFATSGRKQRGQQVQRAIAEWDGRRMGFHDDGSHGVGVQLRPSPIASRHEIFVESG